MSLYCRVLGEITLQQYPNINDAWFQSLKLLYYQGETVPIDRGSFEKELYRIQVPMLAGIINDPVDLTIVSRYGTPQVTTSEYIDKYYKDLLTSNKKEGEDYTYGERINEDNQLLKCIAMLQQGYTNQAAISIAKPNDIELKDPPCLRHISFMVKEDKIHMGLVFRSWDIYAGFPTNLGGLAKLLAFVVGFTDKKIGRIYYTGFNAHYYSNSEDIIKEILNIKE
jgi:thymidylate synthase